PTPTRPIVGSAIDLDLLSQEIAAGIEHPHEPELIGIRRLEPTQRGSDGEVPAAGGAGCGHGIAFRAIGVDAGQHELAVLVRLLVHGEAGPNGLYRAVLC